MQVFIWDLLIQFYICDAVFYIIFSFKFYICDAGFHMISSNQVLYLWCRCGQPSSILNSWQLCSNSGWCEIVLKKRRALVPNLTNSKLVPETNSGGIALRGSQFDRNWFDHFFALKRRTQHVSAASLSVSNKVICKNWRVSIIDIFFLFFFLYTWKFPALFKSIQLS